MARPRKNIEKNQFEKLCALQCTKLEICDVLGISDKTLDAWCKREYKESFSVVYSKKRSMGKVSLRRNQFKLAEKSTTMAIWLGKQYLDQTDDPKEKIEAELNLLRARLNQLENGEQETTEDKVKKLFDAIHGELNVSTE